MVIKDIQAHQHLWNPPSFPANAITKESWPGWKWSLLPARRITGDLDRSNCARF